MSGTSRSCGESGEAEPRCLQLDLGSEPGRPRGIFGILREIEGHEALRNVPLSRSVKLCGASRIVLGAAQLGILGDVLDAIRSYRRS